MRVRSWKEKHQKEPVSPEIRRARIWIALAIGIGCGWAMAAAADSIPTGAIVGAMFFAFLMIRRGRV